MALLCLLAFSFCPPSLHVFRTQRADVSLFPDLFYVSTRNCSHAPSSMLPCVDVAFQCSRPHLNCDLQVRRYDRSVLLCPHLIGGLCGWGLSVNRLISRSVHYNPPPPPERQRTQHSDISSKPCIRAPCSTPPCADVTIVCFDRWPVRMGTFPEPSDFVSAHYNYLSHNILLQRRPPDEDPVFLADLELCDLYRAVPPSSEPSPGPPYACHHYRERSCHHFRRCRPLCQLLHVSLYLG